MSPLGAEPAGASELTDVRGFCTQCEVRAMVWVRSTEAHTAVFPFVRVFRVHLKTDGLEPIRLLWRNR
jgi:hypothetical protein